MLKRKERHEDIRVLRKDDPFWMKKLTGEKRGKKSNEWQAREKSREQ